MAGFFNYHCLRDDLVRPVWQCLSRHADNHVAAAHVLSVEPIRGLQAQRMDERGERLLALGEQRVFYHRKTSLDFK